MINDPKPLLLTVPFSTAPIRDQSQLQKTKSSTSISGKGDSSFETNALWGIRSVFFIHKCFFFNFETNFLNGLKIDQRFMLCYTSVNKQSNVKN